MSNELKEVKDMFLTLWLIIGLFLVIIVMIVSALVIAILRPILPSRMYDKMNEMIERFPL